MNVLRQSSLEMVLRQGILSKISTVKSGSANFYSKNFPMTNGEIRE